MRIVLFLGVLPLLFAFNNCSQGSNFGASEAYSKGDLDGQSVEIVLEEESDDGLSDSPSEENGLGSDSEAVDRTGHANRDKYGDKKSYNDDKKKKGKKETKERVAKEEKVKKESSKKISCEKLKKNENLLSTLECHPSENGNGRGPDSEKSFKQSFIWVCHSPSGDEDKAESKCLPTTGLRNKIIAAELAGETLNAYYLGRCDGSDGAE